MKLFDGYVAVDWSANGEPKQGKDSMVRTGLAGVAAFPEAASAAFRRALGRQPPRMTFVPIPPSKAPQDPLYDDRVTQMLRAIWPAQPADVREIILQPESTDAAHDKSGETHSAGDPVGRYARANLWAGPPARVVRLVPQRKHSLRRRGAKKGH